MKNWKEFFEYLNNTYEDVNKKADKTALIDPNAYAAWEGVRGALNTIINTLKSAHINANLLSSDPCYQEATKNIISRFKDTYKNSKDKVCDSVSPVNHYDKLAVKSAYNAIIEIETKFNEVKENYEKTEMPELRKQETNSTAEEVR